MPPAGPVDPVLEILLGQYDRTPAPDDTPACIDAGVSRRILR